MVLPEAVPIDVDIDTVPVTAPGITIPTRVFPLLDITRAAFAPIVKAVGLPRLVPVIVISVPTGPIDGEKEVMVGSLTGEGKADKRVKPSEPTGVSVVVLKKVKSCNSALAKSSVPLFVFLLRVNSDP